MARSDDGGARSAEGIDVLGGGATGAAHTMLVTGAGGQLGRDVIEAAAHRGWGVVGLGRAELDVTDDARVAAVVRDLRPDAIVHCAAWTDVDGAEADLAGAFAVNGHGTATIADAAASSGAYLVLLSTDYVFGGDAEDGYAEGDAPDPVNAYGDSKLAAERAALAIDGAAVVRTSWLFGRTGTNFVRTIARLASERDAIDVVDDQRGCPTYTRHLAGALVECCERRLPGIVHLTGSPAATWFDLARAVVEELGASCEVRPTTSDRFPRPARRPACSILRVTRGDTPEVGDWRDGVREVVAAIRAEGKGPEPAAAG